MIGERFLSVSVKERHPPSKENGATVKLPEHEESSGQQFEYKNKPLAHKTELSKIVDAVEGKAVPAEPVQEAGNISEDYFALNTHPKQTSVESLETLSAESSEERDRPEEDIALFDLSGFLIREPSSDKLFRVEEVDSVQGIEKSSFSLLDLLILTRSTQLQQKIAATKAICNIFRSTCDGTLTCDEICAVLQQFENCCGYTSLVGLLEISNFQIFLHILEIVSFLLFEVQESLKLFEDRWSIIGLLEEDLEKLSSSGSEMVFENTYGFNNANTWKKISIAARLVECLFLSKFLDKIRRLENLRTLRKRAYYTLTQLFVSYVVFHRLQDKKMRNTVAFEVGTVLVKNIESYDRSFASKMITFCLIILPTWKKGLNTVLKLEAESAYHYQIQSLRIVMHLCGEEFLQSDVFCYFKSMLKTWKNSDYSTKRLPSRESLLLCIEYCKLMRIKNVLLDSCASDMLSEVFSLFNFLVSNVNHKDEDEFRFYILHVSEFLVDLFLGSSYFIRCSFEEKMESLSTYLVAMSKELMGLSESQTEVVEFALPQNNVKQALLFAASRITFLLQCVLKSRFSNFERLVSLSWRALTKYENTNEGLFAVGTDISGLRHVYYMTLFLADVNLERFRSTLTLSELGNCLKFFSIVLSMGLFSISKNYFHNIFAPKSLSIALNNWNDAKLLSLVLESQMESIMRNHREFWWWIALTSFIHTDNLNNEYRLVLLIRFFVVLVKRTDVFESSYAVFFYRLLKQIVNGPNDLYQHADEEIEEFVFYLLIYDSCRLCNLYLEMEDPGSSLVDSLVDIAYSHLFSNDMMIPKIAEVFQTTIFHFLLNPSYREDFRLGLWQKCVKSNFQLCNPSRITGPLCHYVKRCTDDLCFITEALEDICRGFLSKETCFFVYKSICIRVATTVFEEPHYWHLLNLLLSYGSLHDIADTITEVFISDFFQSEETQIPKIYSQMEVSQVFQNANVSEDKLKKRLKLAATCFPSLSNLLQNCPFLSTLYESIDDL